LPEFDARPKEQQDWLVATWRAKQKIRTIEAIEEWAKIK